MRATIIAASIAGLLSLGGTQARADLTNATIHGQYFFPDSSTVDQDLGNKVVNPTAVFDFTAAGGITFTISGTRIVTSGFTGTAFGAAFNGPLFTVVSGGSQIIGVTVDEITNVPGFNSSRVQFTSNSVSENVQGLTFPANPNITLDLQFATTAVPEPSTLTIGATGALLALGAHRWRRRRLPCAAG
jgi:hypothetical protein